MSARKIITYAWPLVPIVAALLFTAGLLVLYDANPIEAIDAIFQGLKENHDV